MFTKMEEVSIDYNAACSYFCIFLSSSSENEIDMDTLPLLEEKHVDELIPKLGVRLKFLRGWKEFVSVLHPCQR